MWIASTIGWLSVVRDRQTKGGVLVRPRAKADIDNLHRRFGKRYKMTQPRSDETRDYRWRVSMKRRDWVKIVAQLASEVDYCNFKSAVHARPDQSNKDSAYLSVWSAMLAVQRAEDPVPPPSSWQRDWDRELDYASGRFDDPDPVPTNTIRSVLAERHARKRSIEADHDRR
jgi:hypothetical protein